MSLIFPSDIHHTLFVQKGIPRNVLQTPVKGCHFVPHSGKTIQQFRKFRQHRILFFVGVKNVMIDFSPPLLKQRPDLHLQVHAAVFENIVHGTVIFLIINIIAGDPVCINVRKIPRAHMYLGCFHHIAVAAFVKILQTVMHIP